MTKNRNKIKFITYRWPSLEAPSGSEYKTSTTTTAYHNRKADGMTASLVDQTPRDTRDH